MNSSTFRSKIPCSINYFITWNTTRNNAHRYRYFHNHKYHHHHHHHHQSAGNRYTYQQCQWYSSTTPTQTGTYANSHSHSIRTAMSLLNLPHHKSTASFSPRELRDAYFTAAKVCHPDSSDAKGGDDDDDDEERQREYLTNQFHAITEAYELLQQHPNHEFKNKNDTSSSSSSSSPYDYVTKSEEQHFRDACMDFLGVSAEQVEESKQCPLFRQWLKGRTVDAFLWNMFLMKHGGLAPMLRKKKIMTIAEGDVKKRRRRKR